MPRGYPDWGVVTAQLGAPEFDTGEMAARIGSPYSYLRRGKVLFIDSFEIGWNSWRKSPGATGSISLTTFQPYHGAKAIKFVPPSGAGDYAGLLKYIPRIIGRRVGVECMVGLVAGANTSIFSLEYFEVESAVASYWDAQIDADAGRLKYRNGLTLQSGFTNLAWEGAEQGLISYHHLKLVVDVVARELQEVWFNGTLYEPSNKTEQTIAAVGEPDHTFINLQVYETASQAPIYVDAVTITVDE